MELVTRPAPAVVGGSRFPGPSPVGAPIQNHFHLRIALKPFEEELVQTVVLSRHDEQVTRSHHGTASRGGSGR
jgi:hypothetical protein